jgi:hypothetical protein
VRNKVRYFIDGNIVATHSTFPASTTRMGWYVGNAISGVINRATLIDFIHVWSDDPASSASDTLMPTEVVVDPSNPVEADTNPARGNTPNQTVLFNNEIADNIVHALRVSFEKLSSVVLDMALWVRELRTDKVQTKELCIEDVCVTKAQLQGLLNSAGGAATTGDTGGAATVPTPPATTTPLLLINGSNPTVWVLNMPWADTEGATFTYGTTSGTVHSSDQVDTAVLGTTSVTYSMVVPGTQEVLHVIRQVIVQ